MSTKSDRCDYCGARWDRPGFGNCDDPKHAVATRAQAVIMEIESELNGRRSVGWTNIDKDIADELRDRLAVIVEKHLDKAK